MTIIFLWEFSTIAITRINFSLKLNLHQCCSYADSKFFQKSLIHVQVAPHLSVRSKQGFFCYLTVKFCLQTQETQHKATDTFDGRLQ